MWPSTTVPPGRWLDGQWYKTLLGQFYLNGRTYRNLFSELFSPVQRLEILKQLDGYRTLRPDVLEKLSRLSFKEFRTLAYAWRAIEDAFMVSTPTLRGKPVPVIFWRLWRWVLSYGVHSPRALVSDWKKVVLFFRHFAADSPTKMDNMLPSSVPCQHKGFPNQTWIQEVGWMNLLLIHQKVDKRIAQCVSQFCQYRNQPVASLTFERKVEEAEKLTEQYNRKVDISDEDIRLARHFAGQVGERVCKLEPTDRPHISLSAAADFEAARSEGGRVVNGLSYYLQTFLYCTSSKTVRQRTWFGAPYVLERGKSKFTTMCRVSPIRDSLREFLHSSFTDEFADPQSILAHAVLGTQNSNQSVQEHILGIDCEFSQQLLQCAIEAAIDDGVLEIEPYRNIGDLSRFSLGKPLIGRLHFISEPCDKVRALTIFKWYVNVILQPFAHWLAGFLALHPMMKASFNKSYKCWDFCNDLSVQSPNDLFDKLGFGALDLVGATNGLRWKYTRSCLEGFLDPFELDDEVKIFFQLAMSIIFRNREVYFTQGDLYIKYLWEDGHPMSDAGTKEILCLQGTVCHLVTVYKQSLSYIPMTMTAGDDIIYECSLKFFRAVCEQFRAYGSDIQVQKVIFSKIMVFFCEEALFTKGMVRRHKKAFFKVPYEERIHVDAIKLRLLVPYGVQSLNQSPEIKNPMIGKGGALKTTLEWAPDPLAAEEAKIRFFRNCSHFVNNDPLVFFPRSVGGCGLPIPPGWDGEELVRRLKESGVPPEFYWIFQEVTKESGNYHPVIDRLTRVMASGGSSYGLLDPMVYQQVEQYAAVATSAFFDRCKKWEDLRQCLLDKGWEPDRIRGSDILRYARSQGLKSWMEIAHDIDRISVIKTSILVADGQIPLSDVLPDRTEHRKYPSEVCREFASKEIPKHIGTVFGAPDVNATRRCWEWIKAGFKPDLKSQMDRYFIPGCAIGDPTQGMRIPLPWVPNEPVPGSMANVFTLDDTGDLFVAQQIVLRRLYG